MAGKTWLNCLKHQEAKGHTKKKSDLKGRDHDTAITADPQSGQRSEPEGCIDPHQDDISITEDLIDPEYLLDPPENWRLDINATSAKELKSNGHCGGAARKRDRRLVKKEERDFAEVILPPNKMSVAVQVVNGREQGTEEEEELQEAGGGAQEAGGGGAQEIEGGAQAMDITEEDMVVVPRSPREEGMSDSELYQSGAPKKKKFKAWKSIKKIFKKKKSSKGSEGDSTPNKNKSKSTSELETGGDEEGELNKRISMSEDSVFTPDKPASAKDRSSYSLNTSNLADEISAKLKERASSSDDGYAQSSEDAMTTGDTTHDNSYVAPSDSSKTDSGIITTEDEKSFTSIGVKDSHHVTADMKRLKSENLGDVDLDLIRTSNLLPSSAAKHRISVAPSNRRPSRKARARTPQKRSSSRLDDAPSPIAEEPTTPTKSPTPLDLDNEEKGDTPKKDAVPVVIIESPSSDDLKSTLEGDSQGELGQEEEEEEEEPMILPQIPKEVIIIMKDDPPKKDDTKKEPEKEAKPSTPTTPVPPTTPVETNAPEEDAAAASPPPPEMKKKEEVEKESAETEKDVEEKKEEADAVEERRLSVAASKALFEARIPAGTEPTKSSNKGVVNGNGTHKAEARRSSQPIEAVPETKAEADTKLSEKEEKKVEKKEEKEDGNEEEEPVFTDKEEAEESKEEPVSLRDRISKYQNLATKTSVKGLTAHVGTRSSPSKQRPASTSNIENKDSPKKFAPKVPSKPSSTSSNKPSGSTATTTEPSKASINPSSSSTSTTTTTSTTRKPLQPKIDRCMVCDKAVYPNESSKFEGRVFHRTCQKCCECSRTLTLWNLDIADDHLYCKQHGTVVKNNQLKEKLII
ncbi:neurofilament heavy polypeptide isoform X2 [Strongylocentrotus purpuratus]|uniref:LIM zinc-binding domain-containing protein n=1 Tax=Strongylocentrotus purpuratus TaxID=7668 RepID=A0A7M7NGY9_STRPU|nr:neurofilament heavy polypeptide isoform X2 [Strongylocentrotus purpuratus]